MTETLVSFSLIAVYSAMVIYALAFIAFTVDLARRVTPEPATIERKTTIITAQEQRAAQPARAPQRAQHVQASRAMRAAMAMAVIGFVTHVASVVLRGLAAGYAPWSNMFGFALTATALIVGVFLLLQVWLDIRFLGVYVVSFALIFLGVATVNFYVDVVPLPPALQSTWLVIHVFVAVLATAFFSIGAGLSLVQLVQARRENSGKGPRFLETLPSSERLENTSYQVIVIGFVFWTFTLIAGAVWAERAWGRYWGWDTKEVWTFIIWTLYAGYIHARATRGWRGARSAVLAIVGFSAVLFNFTVVNLFFKGLHAYSGLK